MVGLVLPVEEREQNRLTDCEDSQDYVVDWEISRNVLETLVRN